MSFTNEYINNLKIMVKYISNVITILQSSHSEYMYNILYGGYANRYGYVMQYYDPYNSTVDIEDINNLMKVGNSNDISYIENILTFANNNPEYAEILGM